jgi:hypothetical protein
MLWKMARQKVLLDEHWLCTLLDEQCSLHPHVMSTNGAAEFASGERSREESLQVHINLTILIAKIDI